MPDMNENGETQQEWLGKDNKETKTTQSPERSCQECGHHFYDQRRLVCEINGSAENVMKNNQPCKDHSLWKERPEK